MKEFLKYTFATVTGLIITGVLVSLISFIFIISIMVSSGGSTTTSVQKNSVMQMDLNGSLEERTEENPLKGLKIVDDKFSSYGLDDILRSIRKAKTNPNIRGIYIKATSLSDASFASIQEIRNGLIDFKKSGKFIISYSDNYTQGLYYLCSVSNKMILNPDGNVEWKGLSAQTMFYKDLLEKLGVKMQVFRVGTFKSAVEPYILNKMSDANRMQMSNILHSIWSQLLDDVSLSRGINKQQLNTFADNGMMFMEAKDVKKNKMVDYLAYQEDVPKIIKSTMKVDDSEKIPLVSLDEMVNVKSTVSNKSDNEIAVYYAFGEIDGGTSSDESGIKSETVVSDLKELADNNDIKAVVLRVNSPGGSAFGSEQIWNAIKNLKKKKPVIVSMGDYAASGGYYISSGASVIVAQPTTLTGSIGIFGLIPEAGELAKKVGISFDNVKTNKFSDFGDISRGMNPEEQALIQMEINRGYNLFLKRCAEGRKRTTAQINTIAQGRVWTGSEALKLGLVDNLGGLDDAIKIASRIAKIKGYSVKSYPKKEDVFTSLFNTEPTKYIKSQILKSDIGEYFTTLGLINRVQNHIDAIQTRMPYNLTIR